MTPQDPGAALEDLVSLGEVLAAGQLGERAEGWGVCVAAEDGN